MHLTPWLFVLHFLDGLDGSDGLISSAEDSNMSVDLNLYILGMRSSLVARSPVGLPDFSHDANLRSLPVLTCINRGTTRAYTDLLWQLPKHLSFLIFMLTN